MQLFHRDVKVIVVSAYPLSKQQKMVMGADDYYDKSEGVYALLLRIRKVFDETKVKEGTYSR